MEKEIQVWNWGKLSERVRRVQNFLHISLLYIKISWGAFSKCRLPKAVLTHHDYICFLRSYPTTVIFLLIKHFLCKCDGITLWKISIVGNKYILRGRHTCYQSRNGREKTVTLNCWSKIEKFSECFQRPCGQISRMPFGKDLWIIYQCPAGISIQSYQQLPCCGLK